MMSGLTVYIIPCWTADGTGRLWVLDKRVGNRRAGH